MNAPQSNRIAARDALLMEAYFVLHCFAWLHAELRKCKRDRVSCLLLGAALFNIDCGIISAFGSLFLHGLKIGSDF